MQNVLENSQIHLQNGSSVSLSKARSHYCFFGQGQYGIILFFGEKHDAIRVFFFGGEKCTRNSRHFWQSIKRDLGICQYGFIPSIFVETSMMTPVAFLFFWLKTQEIPGPPGEVSEEIWVLIQAGSW